MRLRNAGFTVVEMMVVAAVMIVILVLLTDMFVTAMRHTHSGRVKVDMQSRALFAMKRWEDDIETASARYMVTSLGERSCVALTSADAVNGNRTVTWKEEIVCWGLLPEKEQLIRDTYPPAVPVFAGKPSPSTPYVPTPSELEELIKESSGKEKIMCEDVKEFSLTDREEGADLSKQPLVFKLKLRRPLSTTRNMGEFSIERRYTLRNSY